MKTRNVLIGLICIGLVMCIIFLWYSNVRINKQTQNLTFSEIHQVPYNKVGLLLGTSQYLESGQINLYFKYRIDATVLLYKSGKVNFIVVSGDNSRKDYNEPLSMKNELIRYGIPAERIYLDYAGFRTLDSVYRMKEIFGQTQFTVISQKFHNQRAIFIANSLSIDAVGFNAKDVHYGFKTNLREKFARGKALLDVTFVKKPKFLGEKIIIE